MVQAALRDNALPVPWHDLQTLHELGLDAVQRIPIKGKDPVMDVREKAFSRIATRLETPLIWSPLSLRTAPTLLCLLAGLIQWSVLPHGFRVSACGARHATKRKYNVLGIL